MHNTQQASTESVKKSPLKSGVLFAQTFCRSGPHKVVHFHARSRREAAAERGERLLRVETGWTLQPVLQPPLQVCTTYVILHFNASNKYIYIFLVFNVAPASRSGYLTLFGRHENACAAYEHFRQFDNLLSKLARGKLGRGEQNTPLNRYLTLALSAAACELTESD